MSFHMQPVTVAIADSDRDRRAGCERFIQNELGITLLKNVTSSAEVGKNYAFVNRRLKPRNNVTASENEVARIKRLNPHVLLVNLNLSTDEECALLLSLRRECPESLMVLLTDDSVRDNQIIQVLELGARGYMNYENVQYQLPKAIQVVGRGEAWVPRKMLGNIMDYMLNSRFAYQ
ncbi:MAG: DNA-binding response regulator [Pseudomonadota bacterium]